MYESKPHWMGFNIHAMSKPRTEAEISALLDEALQELKRINALLAATFQAAQAARDRALLEGTRGTWLMPWLQGPTRPRQS